MRGQSLLYSPLDGPLDRGGPNEFPHRSVGAQLRRQAADGQWWQLIAELPTDAASEEAAADLGKAGPAC